MASALTMSVPRRKPLSTSTGMRPATAPTISGNASIVARPLSSTRPPWFETMMPSTPLSTASVASSPVRIPLSMILVRTVSRSRLTKSQVRFVALKLTPARSIPSKIWLTGEVVLHGLPMAGPTLPVIHAPHPEQCLPVLRRQYVDGNHDHRAASAFRALGQGLGDLPLPGRIQLEPHRRTARRDGILDRGRRDSRKHLQMVARLRRPRDGHFAFRVKRLVASSGTDDDRAVVRRPQ